MWVYGKGCKPLVDEMGITHQGRSETVKRALSDFGIECSFAAATKRFNEHYHFNIAPSAASRTTKQIANEAFYFIEDRLANAEPWEEEQLRRCLLS